MRCSYPPAVAQRRRLVAALALLLGACATRPPGDASGSPDAALPPDPAAGAEVVLQALAQVGKPYRWGGTDPRAGFDCSGLVVHVYRDALGIRLPRTSSEISRRGGRVGSNGLAAGDLVFFNTARRAHSHVGIYIGSRRFVHAPSSGSLVRVERIDNRYWSQRYDGARRIVTARS
ncbi:MAG: C40 family peptidase [Lautropia sp.]